VTGPPGQRWFQLDFPYIETILGDLTDPIGGWRALAAWEQLEAYSEAARYQFSRRRKIFEEIEAELRAHPHDSDIEIARDHIRRHTQTFVDLHFYLDCFAMVETMMEVLVKVTGWSRCATAFAKWKPFLENYAQARHHMQHIDERFPGGKHARPQDMPGEDSTAIYVELLSAFPADRLTFGNDSWDVGPKSLELLDQAVAEFSQALAEDVRDFFVNERPYQTQRGIYAVTPRPRPTS